MRPAFIIRMAYAEHADAREIDWRFDYFARTVLPLIRAQTVTCDVWVWTHPRHAGRIAAMGVTGTFTVADHDAWAKHPISTHHPWTRVRSLPKYEVQLRLDSDDLIAPNYVEVALGVLRDMPTRPALVHFQPWKFIRATRQLYDMRVYHPLATSAFCALRQHLGAGRYSWVHARGHTGLGRMVGLGDHVRIVGSGFCAATVHDFNDTTALHRRDIPLEGPLPDWIA